MKDWDDIRYFLAIAEAGSLAGAARSLGVNHSTVFRRANAVEERLGVQLFDRLPEGYRLTEAGESILEAARRAEAAVLDLERQVIGEDYRLEGHVRLTTAPNLAVNYVVPLLPRFAERYPSIRVEVAVADVDFDLVRREADLALRATPQPPDYLVGRRICDLPWFACAGKATIRRWGRPADESDLERFPLIGAGLRFSRLRVFAWLAERFGDALVCYTADDLATMAAMTRAGLGIAMLPGDQDHDDIERLFPVCPQATAGLWLLTHPDLRHTARVRALMKFLHEALGEDPRLQAHSQT